MSKNVKIGREAKFLNAIMSGRTISRAQARSWYKLANPSAAVLRFEIAGYDIGREYYITTDNTRKVKYSKG